YHPRGTAAPAWHVGGCADALRMDPAFTPPHDDISWLVMYTMRNRGSHGYEHVMKPERSKNEDLHLKF
ncbi:MAG: hypothetical protein WBB60_16405, partial [Nitrospira sp.]